MIDSGSFFFTDVTYRSAKIHWEAPGLGDWQWPIQGYEIQISTDLTWSKVDGSESQVPGSQPADSYEPVHPTLNTYDAIWGTCPVGEGGETMVQCADAPASIAGTITSLYWKPGDATSHDVVGLQTHTMYYFRIRARNHDGSAEYSRPSYGLLTHDKPNTMEAPVIHTATHDSLTILFNTPITTGSNDCNDIAVKRTNGVSDYLEGESCTASGDASVSPEALPQISAGDAQKCAGQLTTATCQSLGSGSPVTAYRIYMSKDGDGFTELKSATTGLSLYGKLTCAHGYYGDNCEPCSSDPCNVTTTAFIPGPTGYEYSYTIDSLEANTQYQFKVKATNAAGFSDYSPSASGTTLQKPMKPHAPVATSLTATSIKLTWNTEVGYCSGEDTEPSPTESYTSLTNIYPNDAQRTLPCKFDNNVPITGYRLFASSYNPGLMYVSQDEPAWNASTVELETDSDWEPARRGSLTTDSTSTAYAASPMTAPFPDDLSTATWLEINVGSGPPPASFVVDSLAQDTYYKFKILFTNAVGDSDVSDSSTFILTLEEPVDNLKMHAEPPCIYEQSRKTRFVATSSGTNVFYKWQLPDGVEFNAHNTMSFGSVIAEGGLGDAESISMSPCLTDDCSVMEFTLPAATTNSENGETDFSISVMGYNTRGQKLLTTTYDIQYCGCTDPWDKNYWDQATYHLPLMCDTTTWDGADKTVIANEFQYYQTYYDEDTHSAQVIVRVDEGKVDLFTSTEAVPDPAMSTTYTQAWYGIDSFYVMEIPYEQLAGSTKLYVAIRGSATATFSRFAVVSTTREFTRGRGAQYALDARRTQLLNIEPQAFEIKTPYYDFFEYYFGKASNDMDVEIKVNCQLGCVNVFTSKIERYPSALRDSGDYKGFWEGHSGLVCAGSGAGQTVQNSAFATASFDGTNGVYGMVSFSQMVGSQTDEDDAVTVSISMKGLSDTNGAITWQIMESAVSTENEGPAECSSTGGHFATLPGSVCAGDVSCLETQNDPDVVYTQTFASTTSITMVGESIASASEGEAEGNTPAEQSIIGRSVQITIPRSGSDVVVCATIYPDSQVTSYIGELSLMHTIKPEETVSTCLRDDGVVGACGDSPTQERLIFASVQGASPFAVGDEQVNNEYTIEAKVYRYRIESNLLQPQIANTDCVVRMPGYVGSVNADDDVVNCGHAAEDRRYSVVSIDNFNYYEVDVSPAAFGLTIHFTLYYGQVELYTSEEKLPTQDQQGHDMKFGDVYSEMDSSVACASSHCVAEGLDAEGNIALTPNALHQGQQFQTGSTYRITVPYSEINNEGKYIFLGVLGKAPDSSYEISVTEYLFTDSCDDVDGGCALHDGQPAEVLLTPNQYSFHTLYVGPEDEEMDVTQRSHAGRRTGDLGTSTDTWGIDWTETLTTTWMEQQQDEWDLDVNVNIDVDGLDGEITIYGSNREPYPSLERGGIDAVSTCAANATTCTLTLPHFTFADKMVYISIISATAGNLTITPSLTEYNLDKLSGDTLTTVTLCPNECSGAGSCVVTTAKGVESAKCYCDNGYLGDGCEIEAFCTSSTGCSGQPKLTIDSETFMAPVDGDAEEHFPGDAPVVVPFDLENIPFGSKVHVYVDGFPYPAKGANVLLFTEDGCDESVLCTHSNNLMTAQGSVSVYGQDANIIHTTELLLLSSENIPLATDMVDFTVRFAGGCAFNCGSNGICHHGYCVCFDGWAGESCSISESDPNFAEQLAASNFTAGGGFVSYNQALMAQERLEDQYISNLKLAANRASLAASDKSIKEAHSAVVQKLNAFVDENEEKMALLASQQKDKAKQLHRKRDRITTTIQQMREESKRLKTHNTEMYLDTVRTLHEGQRTMQNDLDKKRRDHFVAMAQRHDEWVQIKERNDFKLNQLRTANGPLVKINDLEERVCTQDDMFRTSCTEQNVSQTFQTSPGYESYGVSEGGYKTIGTCTPNEAGYTFSETAAGSYVGYSTLPNRGGSCVCNADATTDTGYEEVCVLVEIDGALKDDLYDTIPR